MGWEIKTFKTLESMKNFIKKIEKNYIYNEIFINNGYAIEYKKLLKIY